MFRRGASGRRCFYCKGRNENPERRFYSAREPDLLRYFRKANKSIDKNTIFCPKCFERGKRTYANYIKKKPSSRTNTSNAQLDTSGTSSTHTSIFASQSFKNDNENWPTNSQIRHLNDKSSESLNLNRNSQNSNNSSQSLDNIAISKVFSGHSQSQSQQSLSDELAAIISIVPTPNVQKTPESKRQGSQPKKYKPAPKSVLEKRYIKLTKTAEAEDDTEDNVPLINLRGRRVANDLSSDSSTNNSPLRTSGVGRVAVLRNLSTSSEEIDPDDLVPLKFRQKKSQIPRQRSIQPPTKPPPPPSLNKATRTVHLPINDYVRSLAG